jgi:hypothetical protein
MYLVVVCCALVDADHIAHLIPSSLTDEIVTYDGTLSQASFDEILKSDRIGENLVERMVLAAIGPGVKPGSSMARTSLPAAPVPAKSR